MPFRTILRTTRPSFLILSPICVFLGTSTATAAQGTIDTTTLILVIVGAVCAHISVNMLNEYTDFRSGLDLITIKTPFSGGSGALPGDPAMANRVLAAGMISLTLTTAIGLYFISHHGALVLPIGIIGLVIILTYTRWINRSPLLCLITPGVGFGILMVVGTHYVLSNENSITPWLAALVPFFLVNNLLLLNQFPDIKADKTIGRNHFPIAFGTKLSSYIYSVFFIAAYATVLLGIYYGQFPRLSLIAVLPVVLSLFAVSGALKHGDNIGSYPQYLGANVASAIVTPLLLGITISYS